MLKRYSSLVYDIAAVFLMMATPLLVFVRHHRYFLGAPELVLVFSALAGLGVLTGLVMKFTGWIGRPVITVFLLTVLVDIQTKWITTIGLRLLLTIIGLSVLVWIFRKILSQTVTLIFGIMFLTTLFLPGEDAVRRTGSLPGPGEARQDLPFILHLILDEHIGIDGIPRQFDPQGQLADELTESFLAEGFQVYSRAYSRFYNTFESIPNLLNFTADRRQSRYFPEGFTEGMVLQENAWFDQLRRSGYRIHVVESDYMRFAPGGSKAEGGSDGSSLSYTLENPKNLENAGFSLSERARQILGSYSRLSYFLKLGRRGYKSVRLSGFGQALALPDWDQSAEHISILAAVQAVDDLKTDLAQAGPGQMFFAHLLLPHSPYGLDTVCQPRPMVRQWLSWDVVELRPRQNDPASRAERYPPYLDQVLCTHQKLQEIFDVMKEEGIWEDAVVIVHGDHGSRLTLFTPKYEWVDEMTPTDFVDAFSTFFVVKQPGKASRYIRDQLPIDHIFAALFQEGEIPPAAVDLLAAPEVFCYTHGDSMAVRPMPFFADGEPLSQ